jgi:predicted nucleotidyltransferase
MKWYRVSMHSLEAIVGNLKKRHDVDAAFLTGSRGKGEQTPSSDLDLVIILRENNRSVRSVCTWIDDTFADVFFFDRSDLERIGRSETLPANGLDAILVSWLRKTSVLFDKTGTVTALRSAVMSTDNFRVPEEEKRRVWKDINYGLVANTRYFQSEDPVYHEALEIRLLHSVTELLTGYLALRDRPWRGEKDAVAYLKEFDSDFYRSFRAYLAATGLPERFGRYREMAARVFPEGYSWWSDEEVVAVSTTGTVDRGSLVRYWQEMAGEPSCAYTERALQ